MAGLATVATALAISPIGLQAHAVSPIGFGCNYHVVESVNTSTGEWQGVVVADFEGSSTDQWEMTCWIQDTDPTNDAANSSTAVPGSLVTCSGSLAGACQIPVDFVLTSGRAYYSAAEVTWFDTFDGVEYTYRTGAPDNPGMITGAVGDGADLVVKTAHDPRPSVQVSTPFAEVRSADKGGGVGGGEEGGTEDPPVEHQGGQTPNCNPNGSGTPGFRDSYGNWNTDSRSGRYKCEKR